MFNKILLPLDGSSLAEYVLPHVVAIARPWNAQVHVLRVLDPSGVANRPGSVDPFDWQIRKTEAETYVKTVSERLRQADVQASEAVLEGKAAEAVVEYSRLNEMDLILMSSHGQSGISGWNVSSVVQKIILRAQRSVMIVRAYQPTSADLTGLNYRRILVALDGSQRAELVLAVAAALARSSEAEILAAHVVKPPEMPRRTPPTPEDVELANQVTERNRIEASRYLEELKRRLSELVETRLLVSENVSIALHELVDQEGVDLVVLSAHGYSGATQFPYGSTVVSFIAYGTTPLLVIQDVPPDRIQPTRAEIAAREQGGR